MVQVHLWDNIPQPVTISGTLATATTYGLAFNVQQSVTLDRLGWYRGRTGSNTAPTALAIYETATNSLLYQAGSVPDDGTINWQWHTVVGTVTLDPGVEYRIAILHPVGNVLAYYNLLPTTPGPLLWAFTPRRFTIGSTLALPSATNSNAEWEAMDVEVLGNGQTGGGGGGSATNVDPALADWLDTVEGTQPHSAPLLDHATLATVRAVVGSTSGQLDATKAVGDAIHDLLTATNKNLGTLWDLAGHLADLEIAAWQVFFGSGAQRLTGPNSAGGSAFYTADGQLVSQLIAEIWQRVRVLRNDVPFGVGDWTLTAEADFTDAIAFTAPADAYVLSITSYQPTQPATESPAGLWLPRLGWWCVLTGTLASERRFVDFEQEMLSDHGRRMPGCAIQLKPGTLAHVQAWVLA